MPIDQRLQFVDGGFDGLAEIVQRAFAHAVDAFVGRDFGEQPVLPRVARDVGIDGGDSHLRGLYNSGPRPSALPPAPRQVSASRAPRGPHVGIRAIWFIVCLGFAECNGLEHLSFFTLIPVQVDGPHATRLARFAFASAEAVVMNRKFTLLFVMTVGLAGLGGCAGGYYVRVAPPPPRYGVVGYAPGPGFAWVDGYWDRRGENWFWVQGRWERPPRAACSMGSVALGADRSRLPARSRPVAVAINKLGGES